MQQTVVVIVADQLRADCFGADKRLPVHTPAIDALRADSAVFENACTQSPVCAPARSAIFTGCVPERVGTVLNTGILPVEGVSPDRINLARVFSEKGYHTLHFGKWNLDPRLNPQDYGFERHEGLRSAHRTERIADDRVFFLQASETDDDEKTGSDLLCESIAGSLQETSGDVYLHIEFPEPHVPYTPKRKYYKQYENTEVFRYPSFDAEDFTDKPYIQKQQLYSWGIENCGFDMFENLLRHYYAFVTEFDAHVGSIIEALKKTGRYENAVIVLMSDHGDTCGSHRMYDKHYIMYDDVIKIPFSIKSPALRKGSVKEYVNASLDLLPTLIDLCSLQKKGDFDGISLAPLISDGFGDFKGDGYVTAAYTGAQFALYIQRMITDGSMKYIWNASDTDELYDLKNDSWECTNLIHSEQYALVLKTLRQKLYEQMKKTGDGIGSTDWTKHQLLDGSKL